MPATPLTANKLRKLRTSPRSELLSQATPGDIDLLRRVLGSVTARLSDEMMEDIESLEVAIRTLVRKEYRKEPLLEGLP